MDEKTEANMKLRETFLGLTAIALTVVALTGQALYGGTAAHAEYVGFDALAQQVFGAHVEGDSQ
jgi:hypothetical protein